MQQVSILFACKVFNFGYDGGVEYYFSPTWEPLEGLRNCLATVNNWEFGQWEGPQQSTRDRQTPEEVQGVGSGLSRSGIRAHTTSPFAAPPIITHSTIMILHIFSAKSLIQAPRYHIPKVAHSEQREGRRIEVLGLLDGEVGDCPPLVSHGLVAEEMVEEIKEQEHLEPVGESHSAISSYNC